MGQRRSWCTPMMRSSRNTSAEKQELEIRVQGFVRTGG